MRGLGRFVLVGFVLMALAVISCASSDLSPISAAWADDDGGDDDDSPAQASSDDRGTVQPRTQRPGAATPALTCAPAPVVRPAFAKVEIVTFALSAENLAALEVQGFEVLEARNLLTLGGISHRLRIPVGTNLEGGRG